MSMRHQQQHWQESLAAEESCDCITSRDQPLTMKSRSNQTNAQIVPAMRRLRAAAKRDIISAVPPIRPAASETSASRRYNQPMSFCREADRFERHDPCYR